jgi:endonuclease/exonuclease/phosphatase family metal-dependent hydrolase
MIYNKNGNVLLNAYDKVGSGLSVAYDKTGNVVFSSEPNQLKIMEYNVGQWYIGDGNAVPTAKKEAYYNLQTGIIEDNDPDILLINEYYGNFCTDGTSALTILQSLFEFVHVVTSGTYYGRAICSKYPISNYTQRLFTGESKRYYDTCTITINSIPVTVCVTHFDPNSLAKREAEVAELISYLEQQTRFICCGDYNTLDCKDTSGADYTAIIEPLLNAGFHCANCTDFGFLETYSDQPTGTWTGCLDNIVTSANIDILSASVDTTKLHDGLADKTDHMPIIATVQLEAQA